MSMDLERAKAMLAQGEYTCVLCNGHRTHHSTQRGVRPLLEWLDIGTDLMGFSAADKVVGRGAAFLYRLLGVRCVHGEVMSVEAVKVLRAGGVEVSWGTLTESIMNRQKNGTCPMELVTRNIQEPETALYMIRATLEKLQQK